MGKDSLSLPHFLLFLSIFSFLIPIHQPTDAHMKEKPHKAADTGTHPVGKPWGLSCVSLGTSHRHCSVLQILRNNHVSLPTNSDVVSRLPESRVNPVCRKEPKGELLWYFEDPILHCNVWHPGRSMCCVFVELHLESPA